MSIDLQRVINSRVAVNLITFLAQGLPPRIAYPICDLIAKGLSTRRHSKLIQAYRLNQWVIHDTKLDKKGLDKSVQATLKNSARDLYEMYHHIGYLQAIESRVDLSPLARGLFERPEFTERGLVILGLHISNFDLILQSIFQRGFKAMVLTIPDPQGGRRVEYEMRKRTGMNIVPASVSALRQAVRHLAQGGMVLTGIDRPIPESKYCPSFFDHPATLPTHYVTLALKARVPAVVVGAIHQANGNYQVLSSEPLEMQHHPDHQTEILKNTEMVLRRAEEFIRNAPQQWNVPLPVWPQLLENMPD